MSLVTLKTDNYTVLIHPSLEGITQEADELVKKGWIPMGSPTPSPTGKFILGFFREYVAPETPTTKKGTKKK